MNILPYSYVYIDSKMQVILPIYLFWLHHKFNVQNIKL